MLARLPFRILALLLFAICAAMLAFGLYLQHAKGIEPCPMCVMQRYALAACGLIGLLAGLLRSKFLVDAQSYSRVRGLPISPAEFEEDLILMIDGLDGR